MPVEEERDFFISYTRPDRAWALWIAVELEQAGYTTVSQELDFQPGQDFVHAMHKSTQSTSRTIAVLSPDYFNSEFGEAEWRSAFVRDPSGEAGLLVPIRVRPCRPPGLLASRIYVDLVNLDRQAAQQRLLEGVSRNPPRPTMAAFPGSSTGEASRQALINFPGTTGESGRLSRKDQKDRAGMLLKVRNKWIRDVLRPTLSDVPIIGLRAERRSVNHFSENDSRQESQVFELNLLVTLSETAGGLVLLGEPGAGKTVALLGLAEALLSSAEADDDLPIPVVLNLSSWSKQRQSLDSWMARELSRVYNVPARLSERWIGEDRLLPLWDGFDEVPEARRLECAQVIRDYQTSHTFARFVVVSRTGAYKRFAALVDLDMVEVLALTGAQVDGYLESRALADLRQLVAADESLLEFFSSPLVLAIASTTYGSSSISELEAEKTVAERLNRLLSSYTQRMLQRRLRGYPRQKLEGSLTWLAASMRTQSQSEFRLDRLQSEWLPAGTQKLSVALLAVFCGLLTGVSDGIVYGLVYGFDRGTVNGLVIGLFFAVYAGLRTSTSTEVEGKRSEAFRTHLRSRITKGLLGGLALGIAVAVLASPTDGVVLGVFLSFTFIGFAGFSKTTPVEQVRWSWHRALVGGLVGAGGGSLSGLLYGLAYGWTSLKGVLVYGLAFSVATGVFSAAIYGLTPAMIPGRSLPNEGIYRSARRALATGLAAGTLAAGVFIVIFKAEPAIIYPVGAGLRNGLVLGMTVGLFFGGMTCLQHLVIRAVLAVTGCLPWRCVKFLNKSADVLFLRRTGGGYIFLHSLLLEYFANQNLVASSTSPHIGTTTASEKFES